MYSVGSSAMDFLTDRTPYQGPPEKNPEKLAKKEYNKRQKHDLDWEKCDYCLTDAHLMPHAL